MKASCIFSVTVRFSNFIIFTMILIIMCDANMAMSQTNSSQERSLRIAIPVTDFKEFVSFHYDSSTGEPSFGGFSIEVFRAVMNNALPNQNYTFIPFSRPDGSMNGTYNDMLQAVFSQEYDGAVGDIEITYERTEWVDFTLPYSETGVSMLVPMNPRSTRSTKISLRPLIKGLVIAMLVFCFISALVFWFVEFKNDTRAGRLLPQPLAANPQEHHINSIEKWRREMLRAIIHTRLVMVICFLVLLFLTSCYTASLTSLLTAQRGKRVPNISLYQLLRNGENVGYQSGSFVYGLLNQTGFPPNQLKSYSSQKEMLDLLSNGTAQGGVAAVVDEIPFLKLVLAVYCNTYALVPSVSVLADGFGFAFPRQSTLVREISKGILGVINNDELKKIQDKALGDLETCQLDPNIIGADPNLLDYDTSWILFAGALGVSILVIILYVVYFGTVCGIRKRAVAYPCYLL